ncbi:hypothetical protein [Pseudopedobacter beijingensis]|uniref:Uncharacterized protein n=1 Tax=Pseudopedobacter beijingensis TaxID=1207056 RepID=A0ABW4I9L9_9SPHI
MMNKEEILKKIGNIIQELADQHQYLSANKNVNDLELELFTANADFLLDHIEIFRKLKVSSELQEVSQPVASVQDFSPTIENKFFEPQEAPKEEKEEESNEVEKMTLQFDFPEPTEMIFDFEKNMDLEDVFDRELTPEEQEVIDRKKQNNDDVVSEEAEEQPIPEQIIEPEEPVEESEEEIQITNEEILRVSIKQETYTEEIFTNQAPQELNVQPENSIEELPVNEPEIIARVEKIETYEEHIVEKKVSLNELLSAQRAQQTAGIAKPIADLKAVISLNDKMIFIKELFNGYNLAYSEAIEILNRFDSFEAADNFLLKNYADKNNWAQKQQVVDRLYEILNRKFKN